jgi:hypothetical protein
MWHLDKVNLEGWLETFTNSATQPSSNLSPSEVKKFLWVGKEGVLWLSRLITFCDSKWYTSTMLSNIRIAASNCMQMPRSRACTFLEKSLFSTSKQYPARIRSTNCPDMTMSRSALLNRVEKKYIDQARVTQRAYSSSMGEKQKGPFWWECWRWCWCSVLHITLLHCSILHCTAQ